MAIRYNNQTVSLFKVLPEEITAQWIYGNLENPCFDEIGKAVTFRKTVDGGRVTIFIGDRLNELTKHGRP